MNRDEIAELAAGYALGALDAEDRSRFEALVAAGDATAIAALARLTHDRTAAATSPSGG